MPVRSRAASLPAKYAARPAPPDGTATTLCSTPDSWRQPVGSEAGGARPVPVHQSTWTAASVAAILRCPRRSRSRQPSAPPSPTEGARHLELVAVGVGQLDAAVPVAELGRPERDQSLDLRGGSGAARSKRCRFLPFLGATGGPPHETLVPPCGDWMAVSSSWSHTSGQPERVAPEQADLPGAVAGTSPRKPQPARKLLPGSITQNSLPPGSARTTWSSSGSCPTSRWRPPSPNAVVDRVLLVLEGGAGQVEVQAVRSGLLRGGRDEPEPDLVSSPGSRAPPASSTTSGRAGRPRTPPGRPGRGRRSSPPPVARPPGDAKPGLATNSTRISVSAGVRRPARRSRSRAPAGPAAAGSRTGRRAAARRSRRR